MHPVLRLYEDVLSTAETSEFQLPPLSRFIFIVHGSAQIAGETVNEGAAWQGEGAVLVRPGAGGVTCWRWELSRGDQGSTTALSLIHISEPTRLGMISYAVFCLKKKKKKPH